MEDGADAPAPPRADMLDGAAWAGFGLAVLAGSLLMDRLEDQDINPYTPPGLLPGLLGIALILMGGLMALRGVRGWRTSGPGVTAKAEGSLKRVALVIALCVAFGAGLVGHGLPFWAAAAAFVTAAIVLLTPRPFSLRGLLVAAAVGLGAGGAITLVFQRLFLVRLP